jgi:putative glutamine amidotransferase
VTRPFVLIAPHTRELDTVLGKLRTSLVYDRYSERIDQAGGEPLIAWPGSGSIDDLLDRADAALLVGGGDVDPERFRSRAEAEAVDGLRDEFEIGLVLACRRRGMPLLGVCRGAQVINVALGGTLRRVDGHRQTRALSEPTHAVTIHPSSRLAQLVGLQELEVNSFHRWAPDALGEGLREVARTSNGLIEALEYGDDWWAVGVQWHPELLEHESSQRLFDGVVASVPTT